LRKSRDGKARCESFLPEYKVKVTKTNVQERRKEEMAGKETERKGQRESRRGR
jgi:hypothetical protein